MFPFLQWIQETKFPIDGNLNLPWAQVTFPIEGDLNLPWSNVAFYWPFSNIDNRMPLSGAVNQNIETDWTMSADDQALNKALFEKAGPWGNQLAVMMDAMKEMVDGLPEAKQAEADQDPDSPLGKFKALHDTVREVREEHADKRRSETSDHLEVLLAKDPEAAEAVIRAFARKRGIPLADEPSST